MSRLLAFSFSWSVSLLVIPPSGAIAQNPVEQSATAPYVGIALGRGALPATMSKHCYTCQDRFDGRTRSDVLELRAGIPVGAFTVESRSTVRDQTPYYEEVCTRMDAIWGYPDGLHTERQRGHEGGAFAASDVRVRYEGATRLPWVVAAGGGWVWTQEVPYLAASIGLRTPGRVRALLDLEWNQYRVPLDLITREWEDFRPVRVVDRKREYDWQDTLGFRLGVEVGLR